MPVLDGFDRALAAHNDPAYEDYRKGFELIGNSSGTLLAKQGVHRIESVGKEFDPNVHHADGARASADYPDGAVIEELPARVHISQSRAAPSNGARRGRPNKN